MGTIATETIVASSAVTIYYTMATTTPTVSSTSIMASGIGLFDSSTVRANTITTPFVEFATISTRRGAVIIFHLRRCCFLFRDRNVSEGRPTDIIEEFSILNLKIPTKPNWDVFSIFIIILHQIRVFGVILSFQ